MKTQALETSSKPMSEFERLGLASVLLLSFMGAGTIIERVSDLYLPDVCAALFALVLIAWLALPQLSGYMGMRISQWAETAPAPTQNTCAECSRRHSDNPFDDGPPPPPHSYSDPYSDPYADPYADPFDDMTTEEKVTKQ